MAKSNNSSRPPVRTGLARLLEDGVGITQGAKVGLVANPTAVTKDYRHIVDAFHAHKDVRLTALFGPEHGIRGAAQDMVGVSLERDTATGVPVVSLYGQDEASLSPKEEDLAGLDVLYFDIQDVGSRYYTYVWTMVLCMRVCARTNTKFVVLDRPNPLGGETVEGGAISDPFRSFVGHCSVPNRHGLTAGEIAQFAKETEQIAVDLEVVTMEGWERNRLYNQTGLPWVMPSPNMPTLFTALVYPGMCLVEGTELSEGRGTTRPFEIAGAPFVDGTALARKLSAEDLPGVTFRPLSFLPMFQKCAGALCGGVQIHVTDRRAYRSYATGVAFLWAVKNLWPDEFRWRHRAYEFRDDVPAIDLLAGSAKLREAIDAGDTLSTLLEQWQEDERAFVARREKWLLYP